MKAPEADTIKLAAIFNYLPNGILLMDMQGHIIEANQPFLQQFSHPKQKLKKLDLRTLLKESNKNTFEIFLSNKPEKEEFTSQEFEIIDRNNQVHQIKLSAIKEKAPQQAFILGILTSKTNYSDLQKEFKKQHEEIVNIKEKSEDESELSEMKSRFLSIASHEFRTPLAGILSSLNLIKRYLDASGKGKLEMHTREKISNHINKISESVKNLTHILNKFLALGNIENGEIPIRYSKVDIKKILINQTSLFQQICKPGQEIFYTHKGEKTIATIDAYSFRNIMNNLLSNAIKFSPEYSEIHICAEIDSEETLHLTISDQGIGIPEQEQKNIYRRFYRAKNALSYQDGTGLGLNIVKKYVEMMHGNITFESKENKGTTFYITFQKK